MSKGVAIVTGAAQGIGRAIALRLAGDGFDIAINDIQSNYQPLDALASEIARKGRKTAVVTADISVESEVKDMTDRTVKILGSVDVMIANAGVCLTKSILETTADDWDHLFAVNARGTFLCYKYAALQMIEQGRGGRIIGAASVAGKKGQPMLSAYCGSKFSVRGLTQTAAIEFGKHGITVNAYAPGAIETTMLEGIGVALGGVDAFYTEEKNKAALGYNGTPENVASTVSYLVSEEAHFITGQSISIDGGRHFD